MTSFKIRFDNSGVGHTASVHKVEAYRNIPLQYIIVDVLPEIKNAPPVFVYCPGEENFSTSECNKPEEVPYGMVKAIKDYCIENGIPLKF
jgi:hypothetical protein